MNIYLVIILAALAVRYLSDLAADFLNIRHVRAELPTEFHGFYDAGKYRRSQEYLLANARFHLVTDSVQSILLVGAILLGAFGLADNLARSVGWSEIPTGLLFIAIVGAAGYAVGLPFTIYHTFVIEARFGFNRTTPATFVLDQVKALALSAIIGAPLFAGVIRIFMAGGHWAWLWCWLAVSAFQILLIFIAPAVIMPLFNKFTPLEPGELRSTLEAYARGQQFRMRGVYAMDGSKRSTKSNAFFTGLGRSKRIVLLDTLMERHPVDELLAVVAHEMGHYKQHHIRKAICRGIASSGAMFFLLSLFIGNRGLSDAFAVRQTSVYASLVFFGFLYEPVSLLLSVMNHAISRKHEYAADRYATESTGKALALASALKRLSADNLSNLTPHPLKVWLHYSHPPMLRRVQKLESAAGS